MSSGYGFIKFHNILQFEYLSTFKDMDGDLESGDVSCGYDSMKINTDFQQNGLKPLMNYNDRGDTDINANLQNVHVSSGIGLLNNHTLPQHNESSNLN